MPFLKFFPDEYLSDDKLRRCSLAARGLFMDMLCLMHKNDRRGYLQLATGEPWPLDQLARICGHPTDQMNQLLRELFSAGVFSAEPTGVLYSRRMVKEHKLYLELSKAGAKGGRKRVENAKGLSLSQANGQASGKPDAKGPSAFLVLNSSILSLEDGGCKGEGTNSPAPSLREFSQTPAGLAQEFVFYQTAKKEDEFTIVPRIEGLMADGRSFEAIAEQVRGRKNKAERFFHIERRLERKGFAGESNGKPKQKRPGQRYDAALDQYASASDGSSLPSGGDAPGEEK